ncbi:MAG: hypothetical protein ACR2KJ_09120 [Jatrophihabitans sp.]
MTAGTGRHLDQISRGAIPEAPVASRATEPDPRLIAALAGGRRVSGDKRTTGAAGPTAATLGETTRAGLRETAA